MYSTNNIVKYTPAAGYIGTDTFSYKVVDTSNRVSDAGLVRIVYATSYTIVDTYGRCLSNGPFSGSYSSVITNTCDGSDGQKWNAPPAFGTANLASVVEVFPTP